MSHSNPFAPAEYLDRQQRLRASLLEAGIDSLVCTSPESLYYLTGYDANTGWSDQACVISTSNEDVQLLIRDIDRPIADGQAVQAELTTYSYGRQEPADLVREMGSASSSLALEYAGSGARLGYVERLEDALGAASGRGGRLPDGSSFLAEQRVRKSPAEMEVMREAARMSDVVMDHALAVVSPGMTEIELAGEIEYAARRAGSDYPAMPTWMASAERTASSHASPTDRRLEAGSPLKFSYAAVKHRYHVTAYQACHLGAPSERYRTVFDQCLEALDALVGAIDVGVPVADASMAGNRALARHGLERQNMGRWGYGVGIAYPPSWLEPLEISLTSPQVFDVGMVFCLHVSMSLPDEQFGFSVGANYTVTDRGVERMNRRAPQIAVVGA